MYSGFDCAMWAILGLAFGGIVGFCIGIIWAYREDWMIDDYYPEDEYFEREDDAKEKGRRGLDGGHAG